MHLVVKPLSFKLQTDFTWPRKYRKGVQRISAHSSLQQQSQMLASSFKEEKSVHNIDEPWRTFMYSEEKTELNSKYQPES